jgi:glycerol-3-phosphate responsive antiterminator
MVMSKKTLGQSPLVAGGLVFAVEEMHPILEERANNLASS